MAGNKVYSSKEIKTLLERATELQKKQTGANEDGLTLEELEKIAADSGINPEFIRQAISEQKIAPSSDSTFHILGGPVSQEVGKEIPHTLSPGDWEMIVQEARRTFRKSGGDLQKLGNSFEWVSPDRKFMQVSVTATPSKKHTRLFVSTSYGKIAFMAYYFGLVVTTLFLGIYLGQSELPAITNISIMLASALSAFGGVRFLFGKWIRSQKRKIEKMLGRFEQIISDNEELPQAHNTGFTKEENASNIEMPESDISESESSPSRKIKNRS
jgi:hypothetical protein